MKTLFISLLLFSYGFTFAQLKISLEEKELIVKQIAEFPDQSEFSIAFVEGEEVLYYGLRKEKSGIKEVENQHHIFQIGSLSKVFTTQLLLFMIEEGKIKSLDEPVSENIELAIKGNPGFSFRQLASHSSGLPADPDNLGTTIFNAKNPYKEYSKEKFESYLQESLVMENQPGEAYKYSNLGMTLLGYAISEVSGQSYEALLQEKIFGPLGMTQSSTFRDQLEGSFVEGRNKKGKITPAWDFQIVAPAGAISSNVTDLVKWVHWNFDAMKNSFSEMGETQFAHNEHMDIALGWHIRKTPSKTPFLWHNGGTGGFKSCLALNAEQEKAVIILTNVGRSALRGQVDILCFKLMTMQE